MGEDEVAAGPRRQATRAQGSGATSPRRRRQLGCGAHEVEERVAFFQRSAGATSRRERPGQRTARGAAGAGQPRGGRAVALADNPRPRAPRAQAVTPPATARVNRHFHMICIRDKFSQNIGRQVPSKVIWDHLSTMYDMQALHESEILPFPNPERNFVLPEEIIQEVREGKVMIEEEMKEEMKEDVDPHNGADDVFSSSGSLGKATEKSSKDKEKNSSDLGCKEGADKRKRSRVTDKVLTANSNPSSPSAAKRRRT
ncbi:PREDICTED: MRG/MORF4L-binding protein [Rhinopithecus bieti]|nr:PREDICTED: MRG/MORF4L-binding protein [Rhinopithecus bieti]